MSFPKVSVVIPTYNRAHYIGIALESVLSQTAAAAEIIVIDDGSTDGTEVMLANYSTKYPQIVYVKQANRGVSAARNRGLAAAKFSIVAFLDSDDKWSPQHLEDSLNCFAEFPDVGFLFAKYQMDDLDSRICESEIISKYKRRDYSKAIATCNAGDFYLLKASDCTHHILVGNVGYLNSTLVINCDNLEKRVSFDENIKFGEDIDFWLQLLLSTSSMAYIDRINCEYVIHNNNEITTRGDCAEKRINKLKNIVKHQEKKLFYCRSNSDYRSVISELSDTYSCLGGLLADVREYQESFDWYHRSYIINRKPSTTKHFFLYKILGIAGYSYLHNLLSETLKDSA